MHKAYLEIIRMRFLMMLAYRVNYYSGIITYSLNIGAYYFLWKAIYGAKEQLAGMSISQMTTYVAVSWMARSFYFNNLDREIATEIKDGSVAVQFIRPYNYIVVKMMQGLGEGLFRFLLFSAPGMIVVSLLFPIQLPKDPGVWAIYLVMLFMSFLINTQINIITGLFAFFLENNEGMMRMKRVAVDLFSGLVVPIVFLPEWAQGIMKLLPFPSITYMPSSVFTGKVTGSAVYEAFGTQLIWFALLILPLYFMWRSARTRLFVQGG